MANITTSTVTNLSSFYTMGANGAVGSTYSVGTLGTMAGYNGSFWTTANSAISASTTHPTMSISGDLEVSGNVTVKGKNLVKLLEKLEDRMAILQEPDPEKLEKFAALKKAYDHYKLMEKLIGDE